MLTGQAMAQEGELVFHHSGLLTVVPGGVQLVVVSILMLSGVRD